jgi:hypothetical protein
VRSRIRVGVKNPARDPREAVLRIPIPPGAAVTDAKLNVADEWMRGVFVERERAKQIYQSFVTVRRDPLLAVWSGPEWIDVTIFPVPGTARGSTSSPRACSTRAVPTTSAGSSPRARRATTT